MHCLRDGWLGAGARIGVAKSESSNGEPQGILKGSQVPTLKYDVEAPIQSIKRASMVLGLFESGRSDLNLNQITELLGFNRATAHRYCMALRAIGMLRYSPDTGTYGLGARVIELGTLALQAHPVTGKADPYLHDLVERVKQTALLSVWDGFAPVVARVNDNTGKNVRISVRAGNRLPTLDTAQGRIYLAYSASIREQFGGRATAGDMGPALSKIRDDGYDTGSITPGMLTVAVPVGSGDSVIATLAVIGMTADVSSKLLFLVNELKRTSARLSQAVEQEELA